ncbi:hypothetical protein V6B33_01690 [Mangrovibacillus sp. Mu-81]|uniref:hypothetical protein n=1 Tax=Mangrovibacillus sp. Mu-81 TaxID=3121478 RepID=UPI002FE48847
MKKTILFMFLLSLGIMAAGCFQGEERIGHSSLSKDEIEQFTEEKGIEPLAVEEVQDSSLVLYENGIYYLSEQNGKLTVNQTGWSGNSKEKVQVGMTSTGSPHANVIIHDSKLLKEADEVKVEFGDGKTVVQQIGSTNGLLMFYDKNKSNLSIPSELDLTIYNDAGTAIYEDEL